MRQKEEATGLFGHRALRHRPARLDPARPGLTRLGPGAPRAARRRSAGRAGRAVGPVPPNIRMLRCAARQPSPARLLHTGTDKAVDRCRCCADADAVQVANTGAGLQVARRPSVRARARVCVCVCGLRVENAAADTIGGTAGYSRGVAASGTLLRTLTGFPIPCQRSGPKTAPPPQRRSRSRCQKTQRRQRYVAFPT